MRKSTIAVESKSRATYVDLEEAIREKVRGFIQDVIEEEVTEFLGRKKSERGRKEEGREGYRNGYGKTRKLGMLSGTIKIRRPRIRGAEERFESRVLPMFKRRTREVGELLPELYLHGLAKGDFELALRGLLGEGVPLSASSIQRLKGKWQAEYEEWRGQDLTGMELVYQWADGIYVKAGLEKEKAALLVIVGALASGKKVIVACESGYRESKESWLGVLRGLSGRGLRLGQLTVADGHLGIWSALGELHPEGKEQRCWNHKIVNVLDGFPKRIRNEAAARLEKLPYADTREKCEQLRDAFVGRYEKEYGRAVAKLLSDWDRMVTFYSFPKEHWGHLRTTNIVESPFSSVRLRTDASKRYKRVDNATAMIWKLLQVAEKRFRALKAPHLLPEVYAGAKFINGIPVTLSLEPERMAA
jgi:transposase-like protein